MHTAAQQLQAAWLTCVLALTELLVPVHCCSDDIHSLGNTGGLPLWHMAAAAMAAAAAAAAAVQTVRKNDQRELHVHHIHRCPSLAPNPIATSSI
jgi:hypothetical protein